MWLKRKTHSDNNTTISRIDKNRQKSNKNENNRATKRGLPPTAAMLSPFLYLEGWDAKPGLNCVKNKMSPFGTISFHIQQSNATKKHKCKVDRIDHKWHLGMEKVLRLT